MGYLLLSVRMQKHAIKLHRLVRRLVRSEPEHYLIYLVRRYLSLICLILTWINQTQYAENKMEAQVLVLDVHTL
jgi:hypothetical protein